MRRFDGHMVLVTGAGSGIGQAAALRLAAEHAEVWAVDLDPQRAQDTVDQIASSGGSAWADVADVSDRDAVRAAIARCVAYAGRLDHVVTAAGIALPGDQFEIEDIDIAAFHRVLDVNLDGTFHTLQAAFPHLRATRGSVVTIGSNAAVHGHGVGAGYTASKGAISALTRYAAVQGGPHGVRVNCVSPGAVITAASAHVWDVPGAIEAAAAAHPLRRIAEAADVAGSISYALSDDARHLTGATIILDGGATIA